MRQFGPLIILPKMIRAWGTATAKQNRGAAPFYNEQGLEEKTGEEKIKHAPRP